VGIVTSVGIVVPPSSWAARIWTVVLNWSSMAVGGLAIADVFQWHQKQVGSRRKWDRP
jgi:hypothetical protein